MSATQREMFERVGWLKPNTEPLFSRLGFPFQGDLPSVDDRNRAVRDEILAQMADGRMSPRPNGDLFVDSSDDVILAETDRYGLPLTTVLSRHTGLVRSDPYYSSDSLRAFYQSYYRRLYQPIDKLGGALRDQIRRGERILAKTRGFLPPGASILDIGCWLGGMLIPFEDAGFRATGVDFDESYLEIGRTLGLDLITGGHESLVGERKFHLVIMSHVLEHCEDPIGILASIIPLLHDQGMIYLEVPGLFNVFRTYHGELLEYLQNAHLWSFTAQTLRAVVERAGLNVLTVNEKVDCLAGIAPGANAFMPQDGTRVLRELVFLEKWRTYPAWRKRHLRKLDYAVTRRLGG